MKQTVKVGDAVTFVDPYGTPRPAIVTAVWGQGEFDVAEKGADGTVKVAGVMPPCINIAHVHPNENMTDQYGRQIFRESSVAHESMSSAHGRFWRNL